MLSPGSSLWSRRELTRLLAAASCAVASPILLGACARSGDQVDDASVTALLGAGLVPDHAAAARLGRLYRRRHREERTIGQLCRALVDGSPPRSSEEWRALASRRLADDVDKGRSTELEGWTMTPTEARLLALASLR